MKALLSEDRFDFISTENKAFMLAFDDELSRLGYGFGDKISEGFCWGKYMAIYRKLGVKSETVYARLYIRETDVVLRFFLNHVDKHREFIEHAPDHIKEVFTGTRGDCEHCHNDKGGACKFRKTYTLENLLIEKCNGIVFEFFEPDKMKLNDYMALFTEFFPSRSKNG